LKSLITVLFLFAFAGEASSAYRIGLAVDSSSNMLMRPDGEAGTYTYLFGDAIHSFGKAGFSYGFGGGVLEHYEGVQFHSHTVDISYEVVSKKNFSLDTTIEGGFSRYGDVTILNGYNYFNLSSGIKTYLTPTTLLRWGGNIGRRSYKIYNLESYIEADTYLRIDRFFQSGTTLRGQIDVGTHRYYEESNKPSNSLLDFSVRVARSVSQQWGIWLEAQQSSLVNPSKYEDTTQINDSFFLDDQYKYSKTGFVLSSKHLFDRPGSIQFRTSYSKKTYGSSQTSLYWYLPPEGWTEREWRMYLTLNYRFEFLPSLLHPSYEIYYIKVDASEPDLSYVSTGITLRFELF
jgi:hypothetical protein